MDCNRDDALKAMQLSDIKLRNKDFSGAMKMAQKAQRLFGELENISQLLAVCKVQCSAENKVGSAMDWYGILQLQQGDDEETLKKQYRKLALLLHPDKNNFAGAEAAFKLIGEAKRFLTDQKSRSEYDKKYSKALRKSRNEVVEGVDIGIDLSRSCPVRSMDPETSRHMNTKRGRSPSFESGESFRIRNRARADSELNGGHHCRRYMRDKENLSSNENLYNDVDFVNPPKTSEHSSEKKDSDHGDELGKGVDLSRPDPASSKGPKSLKKKRGRSSTFESCKSSKTDSNNDRPIDSGTKSVVAMVPKVIEVCETEFNKFEHDENSLRHTLKTNQVWAFFDIVDAMPRFYVIIRKVFARGGFKVRITWLDPDPNDESEIGWAAKNFPVASGKFRLGLTEDTTDNFLFSHEMHCTKGRGRSSYLIYPRKGETWALYKNWDIKWSPDIEKHMPFEFEFVEVISDFSENVGTEVAYLGKVEGFTSLFQRTKHRPVSFVPNNELYRFSHRIPSCKMNGGEKPGVEKGWLELDPASLPTCIFTQ